MPAGVSFRGVLAGLALVGAIGLAALAQYMQRQDYRTLEMMSQENVIWAGAQMEVELHRLEAAIGRVIAASPDQRAEAASSAARRFDILWSRISVATNGDVGARLSKYAENYPTVRALPKTLANVEDDLAALAGPDHIGAATRIFDKLSEVAIEIRQFSIEVSRGESDRAFDARQAIRHSNAISFILGLGALVIVGLMCLVSLLSARRHRESAARQEELAARAHEANAARSRFMAMMSHELRTPMNGVTGLIALARSTGGAEAGPLLDRAAKSAERLMQMLTDIFDLAGERSETPPASAPFALKSLTGELEARLAGEASQSGVPFDVAVDPEAPASLVGDAALVADATSRVADYLFQTAGVRRLFVKVGYDDGALRIRFNVDYDGGAPGDWTPALLTGDRTSENGFAIDALGPYVARRRLAEQGGGMRAWVNGDNRATVEIVAPMEACRLRPPLVRLALSSASMRLIVEAALRRAGIEIMPAEAEASTPAACDALLLEPAYPNPEAEAAAVARMRDESPADWVIAAGPPRSPELFDAVMSMPDDADKLTKLLLNPPSRRPEPLARAM